MLQYKNQPYGEWGKCETNCMNTLSLGKSKQTTVTSWKKLRKFIYIYIRKECSHSITGLRFFLPEIVGDLMVWASQKIFACAIARGPLQGPLAGAYAKMFWLSQTSSIVTPRRDLRWTTDMVTNHVWLQVWLFQAKKICPKGEHWPQSD